DELVGAVVIERTAAGRAGGLGAIPNERLAAGGRRRRGGGARAPREREGADPGIGAAGDMADREDGIIRYLPVGFQAERIAREVTGAVEQLEGREEGIGVVDRGACRGA